MQKNQKPGLAERKNCVILFSKRIRKEGNTI
nr:MAG TPA: hypothetical protein [Caudoviricetes sp.]